jgi:uncharacterized protein (UPF0147 family)
MRHEFGYTKEERELACEVRNKIIKEVKKLVKKIMKDKKVPYAVDELVRTQMSDEFRFWK